MLGCFSILPHGDYNKDMVDENGSKWAIRIWVDEKDFNNKNTTFAANWISQAQRNG